MSRPHLTLYFDLVSPFAYLAFYYVQHSPAFEKCRVTYVPALLGGIIKATGNTPPISIKNKREWIYKERMRWARYFDIPIADEAPQGFPLRTIEVMRALCAVQAVQPSRFVELVAELYRLLWVERRPVHEKQVFDVVFRDILGEEIAAEVMEKASTTEVKQMLQQNGDRAVDGGAFGMPWFVANNSAGVTESYWGFDHLGQVMDHLGLERENLRAML